MNSLVKVFSNFREFYNEINGATLTGAIDVIVVEQPDGEFQCSPFHVRFGKLGVLRSREKIVDIMINGEPIDIHMKLGDSGEAFFVEECSDDLEEDLPDNLATSPIPASFLFNKFENASVDDENSDTKTKTASEEITLPLPLPRRNSIDFSKEAAKEETEPIFENQVSDFSHRRHTDNTLERRNLSDKLKEYTTQKIRQEWAEHEEVFQFDVENTTKLDNNNVTVEDKLKTSINEKTVVPELMVPMVNEPQQEEPQLENAKEAVDLNVPITKIIKTTNVENNNTISKPIEINNINIINNSSCNKEESKNKKKRRKKTQMKKKNAQRKSSSSSSIGSNITVGDGIPQADEMDTLSVASMSNQNSNNNNNNNSSNEDECKSIETTSAALLTANGGEDSHSLSEHCQSSPMTPSTRLADLDIHFFSDTEITSSGGNGPMAVRGMGRPSTPIQSDSEFEISKRDKDVDVEESTSWKWGELPTADIDGGDRNTQDVQAQAQRRSMLSGMFNFMKRTNQIRKQGTDGGVYLSDLDAEGMDPEITAMYFPISKENTPTLAPQAGGADDDGESGNGTSLPHSPSSMEGAKSLDSDYEDGKATDSKYLDFVAMSLCGGLEKGDPTDEEFDKKIINYSDVCKDPSLFASPNLVVRLNGKFYTWAAACPIVMTMITFQKPLSDEVIEQLMLNTKINGVEKQEQQDVNVGQTRRSWWNWRRSQSEAPIQTNLMVNNEDDKISNKSNPITVINEKDVGDLAAVATQTTRPTTPDESEPTLSKSESNINAENTSVMVENLEDLTQISNNSPEKSKKFERYKKSLRLSSDVIKTLNLREGMNEIEFSVTTAYQGTSRCKCCLFRWKHNDKVVISDIDGTITKSDVLGHILPMVGKDWAQLGVAELFSKIEENGYKLLYLSARAIGQSRATREYLRSIRQGDVCLPDGPLLLNPTSLISAFHREVIEKKPEQFKIACLTDIRDLFPDKNPFYAGYGNRINDVWAYRAVGIPIMRIFTINTKGELKHELTQTFQSSYCGMAYIVDQLFPPIDEGSIEYSNFNYWRDPIPDLDLELNGFTESKQISINSTTTTTTTTIANTNMMTSSTNNNSTATATYVNIAPINTSAMLTTIPEN